MSDCAESRGIFGSSSYACNCLVKDTINEFKWSGFLQSQFVEIKRECENDANIILKAGNIEDVL